MVRHDPNYEEKPPVTLEGIASVLAVVPALIGQASQKEQQSALSDALRMLSRACVMAGGKEGPPSEVVEGMSTLEKQCSEALDEYAAFRIVGGEAKTLPERIRLLGDSWQRLKVAHEDVRRSLSEALERETAAHDAGLEAAAKALDMAAESLGSASTPQRDYARDHAKDMAARIRAKKGNADTVAAGGTSISPSLLSENEKRFREEVAASLRVILYPGRPAPDLDLNGLLHEADSRLNRGKPPQGNPPPYVVLADVEKKLAAALNTEPDDFEDLLRVALRAAEDAKKWREREKTATDIRDAALEEVAGIANLMAERNIRAMASAGTDQIRADFSSQAYAFTVMANECRALKSKPASVNRKVCRGEFETRTTDNPREGWPVVINAVSVAAAQKAVDSLRAEEESKPAPIAATMQALQGEGMKRGAEKWERGEMDGQIPEPVTPTIDPCMCYRSAYPHVHIAHRGLTADECSRAAKSLAAAAGVTACVVEPGGAVVPPEPVHDFGWALAQMRAGKKVRRRVFIPGAHYRWDGGYVLNHTSTPQDLMPWNDLTATDWEVAE